MHIGLPGFLGVQVATSDSSSPQQQAADAAQGGRIGRTSAGADSCSTSSQQSGVPARVAPIAAGALIVGVLCNSVAQAAGLVPGDVITSVSGQPVTTPGSLTHHHRPVPPGRRGFRAVGEPGRGRAHHQDAAGRGPGPLGAVQPGPEPGLALGDLGHLARTRRVCARFPRCRARSSPPGRRARRTWPRRSSRAWAAASPPTAAANSAAAAGCRARAGRRPRRRVPGPRNRRTRSRTCAAACSPVRSGANR